jgi:hypothetical protein
MTTPPAVELDAGALLRMALDYLEGSNPLHMSGGHRNMDLRDKIAAHLSALPSDDEGWIEWKGGEQPVPDGTLVRIRTTHPERFVGGEPENFAEHWRWEFIDPRQNPGAANIIAYRVVRP